MYKRATLKALGNRPVSLRFHLIEADIFAMEVV
jgi:hypothetical protein